MATLRQRGETFYVDYRTPQGERKRQSLGKVSRTEAEIQLRELEIALLNGTALNGGNVASMSFEAYVRDEYMPWHLWQFKASHFRTEYTVRIHLMPEFGHMLLSDIDTRSVERWLRLRMETPLSKSEDGNHTYPAHSTVEKELRVLQAILNRAVVDGHLTENKARHAQVPGEGPSKPPAWFTQEELRAIYEAETQGTWRWAWQLIANTGLRRAEALWLPWAEVYEDTRRLHVLSTETRRTKSGKWRDIPLNAGALEALRNLGGTGKGEWVLPRVHINTLTRAAERTITRAGLVGSVHSLRHTFISNLVRRGVNLKTVQELAGHADIKTTMRYAHINNADKLAAVEALDC